MSKSLIALIFAGLFLLAPTVAQAQALTVEPVDRIVAVIEEDVVLQSELDRAVASILAQARCRWPFRSLRARSVSMGPTSMPMAQRLLGLI